MEGEEVTDYKKVTDPETLEAIKDNYPKFLLSKDAFTQNRYGIIHKNVFEWLIEK